MMWPDDVFGGRDPSQCWMIAASAETFPSGSVNVVGGAKLIDRHRPVVAEVVGEFLASNFRSGHLTNPIGTAAPLTWARDVMLLFLWV